MNKKPAVAVNSTKSTEKKQCGTCSWGGERTLCWNSPVIVCGLNGAGHEIQHVCENWEPK